MKIGVVGYGSIGKRHVANLRQLGYDPVIYDPVYGGNGVRFERHIYEACDAVVIATPTNVHWGCIRAAAERGCHMLIEKPMASGDIPGLEASLHLAKSKGAVVMMGCNFRFHPCIIEARRLIEDGHIGNRPLWAQFTSGALSVKPGYLHDGVTMVTGGHEVDFALHLLGPARVLSASARQIACNAADDMADFVLEHDNGCRSSFHLDFRTERETRHFRVVADDGDIDCDLLNRHLCCTQPDPTLQSISYPSNSHFPGSYDDDYIAEMKAFLTRIEGGEALGATGDDGLAVLQILLDVRKMAGLV